MPDDMVIHCSQDPAVEGKITIAIGGALTISNAEYFRQALLGALEKGDELHLDLSEAAEVDLTALQLLWSARHTAQGAGKRVICAGSSAACRRVAESAGFDCGCVEQ